MNAAQVAEQFQRAREAVDKDPPDSEASTALVHAGINIIEQTVLSFVRMAIAAEQTAESTRRLVDLIEKIEAEEPKPEEPK